MWHYTTTDCDWVTPNFQESRHLILCLHIYQKHKTKLVDHAVTSLVVALRYKLEGRGFDSWWCNWHNYSGCIVTLVSTHALTQMSTEEVSWGWRWPVRKADNFTTFMRRLSRNSVNLNLLNPSGPVQAFIGITLSFTSNRSCADTSRNSDRRRKDGRTWRR
jgi:hypothetical protein